MPDAARGRVRSATLGEPFAMELPTKARRPEVRRKPGEHDESTRVAERGADGKKGAAPSRAGRVDLDREWPMLPRNPWPPGFTASRSQLYEDDGR